MSYGLIYTIPFESSKGIKYVIEIEKEGYEGDVVELEADENPIIVTPSENDFLYNPIRSSSATINVVGSDYLQELYSTDYRQYRVTLLQDKNVCWCGFVKPELYTQEYADELFTLSIECVGCFEVLDNVDFEIENKSSSTLWELLNKLVSETRTRYSEILIPHVYALSILEFNNWENTFMSLYVSDQNWFDEDDKSMTCKEVIEEICKLFGWTATDWQGCLCFVDYDNIDGEYYKYDMTSGTINNNYEKVSSGKVVIQDIGYDGDNHTLDMIGGYNKVKIVCSNYPVGDKLPDTNMTSEDFLIVKDEKSYQSETGGYKITHHRIYRPDRAGFKMYAYQMGDEPNEVTEISKEEEKQLIENSGIWLPWTLTGAIPQKFDEYNTDADGNADITDYEYEEEIWIRIKRQTNVTVAVFTSNNKIPVIHIQGVSAAYTEGAFVINAQLMLYAYGGTVNTFDFHFMLRIGNKYYHGKSNGDYYWDENQEQDDEYDNNLLFEIGSGTSYEGPYDIKSQRKLNDGLDGIKGYIIKLPENQVLLGDMELIIYAPAVTFDIGGMYPDKFALKDFSFAYSDYIDSDSPDDDGESDRTYENVVNKKYINEADEIELKISTYNDDGACYSKLIKKTIAGTSTYLTNNMWCRHANEFIRLEEMLIKRIVNQYKSSRMRLTQEVNLYTITPVDVITDESQEGKKFVYLGGEIDYQQDTMTVIMLEKE